jgi:methionyl-tRNA synthetase
MIKFLNKYILAHIESQIRTKGGEKMLGTYILLLLVVIAWSFVWKGIALWTSARNSQKTWFVVLLIVNTVGILEILYLYFFQENKGSQKKVKK